MNTVREEKNEKSKFHVNWANLAVYAVIIAVELATAVGVYKFFIGNELLPVAYSVGVGVALIVYAVLAIRFMERIKGHAIWGLDVGFGTLTDYFSLFAAAFSRLRALLTAPCFGSGVLSFCRSSVPMWECGRSVTIFPSIPRT
ncbi:MAG: hypothetical protein SPK50_08925 [Mobiluncus porci]|uniref:hypothetical protein n=1 Tax=Mobiluncus porci TaxID=2652278 RepID=UPI0023F232F5|nr:hypothetical protein [Mobiluncus porci]MDD7541664.1 hypothetical protein [Mobiluncus porci]MDY5749235.1 hypothetical protein [Mobiluncus porci]